MTVCVLVVDDDPRDVGQLRKKFEADRRIRAISSPNLLPATPRLGVLVV